MARTKCNKLIIVIEKRRQFTIRWSNKTCIDKFIPSEAQNCKLQEDSICDYTDHSEYISRISSLVVRSSITLQHDSLHDVQQTNNFVSVLSNALQMFEKGGGYAEKNFS